MTCWCDTTIEEMRLEIPKTDFPLKSNVVIGYENPVILYPEDEGSYDKLHPAESEDSFVFEVLKGDSLNLKEGDNAVIEELEELCVKYNGTLIASSQGEEPCEPTDYIRIRNGVRKKVKVIEED